jgi:hypothetical protein
MARPATSSVSLDGPIFPSIAKMSMEGLAAYARERLAAARAFPRSRLIRRDYRLARLDLTVWFAGAELAVLCDRSFVTCEADDAPVVRAEVLVLDAETTGWEPPAVWDEEARFSSRQFDSVLAAEGLRGFYHHDMPSWQFFDRDSATGVMSLMTPMGIPSWETGSPLRLFLHWAYASAGLRLTHAATLGANGRGALIIGASGSGKSGTTLAGVLNGLESVGDDYVLVEDGSPPVARSVFAVFKQDPDGLRRAGIAPEVLPARDLNWHGKIEFDARGLVPNGLSARMDLCAILLPEIARARETTIERATAQQAALALAPSAIFQLPGDAAEGFRFFTGLSRSLPAYRLKLSEDPIEIAGAIGAFLAGEVVHSS